MLVGELQLSHAVISPFAGASLHGGEEFTLCDCGERRLTPRPPSLTGKGENGRGDGGRRRVRRPDPLNSKATRSHRSLRDERWEQQEYRVYEQRRCGRDKSHPYEER